MDLRRSTRFCVQDALQLLLDGNGSDIDELESDEDDFFDDLDKSSNEIGNGGFEDEVNEPDSSERTYEQESSDNECDESDAEEIGENVSCSSKQQPPTSMKKHIFRWRSRDIPSSPQFFVHRIVTQLMTPFEYFKLSWTEELNELIAEQTNLYSVQKTGKSVKTSSDEIKKYIGMHLRMGIVHLPSYRMCWSSSMRYSPLADVMPLKRFEAATVKCRSPGHVKCRSRWQPLAFLWEGHAVQSIP